MQDIALVQSARFINTVLLPAPTGNVLGVTADDSTSISVKGDALVVTAKGRLVTETIYVPLSNVAYVKLTPVEEPVKAAPQPRVPVQASKK